MSYVCLRDVFLKTENYYIIKCLGAMPIVRPVPMRCFISGLTVIRGVMGFPLLASIAVAATPASVTEYICF